jgi:two-component system OmpR family sensor kinase
MTYSVRARLTFWYAGLVAAALIVFSGGILWLQERWGLAQFDSELTNLSVAVSSVMREELGESGNFERAVRDTRTSTDIPNRVTAVLDMEGRPFAANWQGFRYNAASTILARPGFMTMREDDQTWRLYIERHRFHSTDYLTLVGGTLDQIERQRALLARILVVATPLMVFATAGICWWVASSALQPVTIMAAQAEGITGRSSGERLHPPSETDELGQLARAFNRLLDRLGTALKMQRQFMADASHELRTPVSVIQTAAEVTLEQPVREPWEYREALTIVNEQSARLSRMVQDMLVLARADAGGFRLVKRLLYLDEVVAECVRAVSVVAARHDVRVLTSLQPDVSIAADDGLLRQLVTNLLDNAVHHTPPGGSVTVTVVGDATVATITVADTGPGIPPADRERVFERFVRLDPARSATSGAGLGLPIARWIAEEHGGTLALQERPEGGCLFVAHLPRARKMNES